MGHKPDQGSTLVDDSVTQEWLEPHLPTAFSHSHEKHEIGLRELSAALIDEAGIKPGDRVLDVASGSGIPALQVARLVGTAGSVTATDPSPIFIAALTENARAAGLSNLTIVQTSAAKLDFPAGQFDAATCQFGVMFFPDVRAGLERIRGVLRSGARAAFLAWGPLPQNHFFGAFWQAAMPYLPPELVAQRMAPPSPAQPSPGRFASPGSLSAELTAAGFADVRERLEVIDVRWPGPAEEVVADQANISQIEQQMQPDDRARFRTEAAANFRRFQVGDELRIPAAVVIASGRA
jgi:ubiquinone/menaquinone biosynthesis C-methylase UbiE